jgi:mono/diheme cytochrome c family protein
MKQRSYGMAFALVFCLALSLAASASESNQGRQFYLRHCSSCHGTDGRGNGAVSRYLKIEVPDLTVLKRNNNGIYPTDKVMSSMDGSRPIRGHGDAEMPVWGEVFRKETEGKRYPELSSLLKARTIAEYIATLQR